MNVAITRTRTAAETGFAALFDAQRARMPGGQRPDTARAAAMARFTLAGLPTRRVEAWHYTDLRRALNEALPLAGADYDADAVRALIGPPPEDGGLRVVLIDGRLAEAFDTPPVDFDVTIRTLARALDVGSQETFEQIVGEDFGSGDAALALNTAFLDGGVVIDIEPGQADAPRIELVSVSTRALPSTVFSRTLVRIGGRAKLTLIERHLSLGDAPLFKNDAMAFVVGSHARLDHVVVHEGAAAGVTHVHSVIASVWNDAQVNSFALVEGGSLLRRQTFLRFRAQDARASLAGVSLLRSKAHADTTLVVEHAAPSCESREFFRHMVDEAATGVFQGRIVVAPHAQKTDGVMRSQAILLSDDAAMHNKPELEIFADDVTCGHGATCAALDEAQVFYAMARGLPRAQAEALLLEAFAMEAIERVEDEGVRAMLGARVQAWLAGRRT